MRKITKIATFVGVVLLCYGCKPTVETYKYEEGLLQMIQVFGVREPSINLLIIPTSGCSPCMDTALETLRSNSFNSLTLIFSGYNEAEELGADFRELYPTFIDTTNSIRKYETGLFSPSLVMIQDDRVIKVKDLTAGTVQEFYQNLEEELQ